MELLSPVDTLIKEPKLKINTKCKELEYSGGKNSNKYFEQVLIPKNINPPSTNKYLTDSEYILLTSSILFFEKLSVIFPWLILSNEPNGTSINIAKKAAVVYIATLLKE